MKKLRFKGFNDNWQEFELGDIGELKTSSVDKVIIKDEKIVKLLNYMDVYRNSYITNNFNFAITSATTNEIKSFDLKHGDILFTPSSETPDDIAHSSVVLEDLDNVLYSYHLMRLRPKTKLNNIFAGQVFKHKYFLYQCYNLAQGNTRYTLSIPKISSVKIKLPSLQEQVKIGELFKSLDESINKTELKILKLKQSKKALLDKLFTKINKIYSKLRFKGFNDNWQEFELGVLGETFTGLSGKTKEDFGYGNAKYIPYLNIFNNPFVDVEKLEKIEIDKSQNQVQYGDIFFTTSSETPEEVGMSSVWLYNINNVYLNSFCFGYRLNIKTNLFFISYCLRSNFFRQQMQKLAQGISRFNISPRKTMELKIKLPSLQEQVKIGELFKSLDESISLYEKKLNKLKQVKLVLLDKVFKGE